MAQGGLSPLQGSGLRKVEGLRSPQFLKVPYCDYRIAGRKILDPAIGAIEGRFQILGSPRICQIGHGPQAIVQGPKLRASIG